MSSFSDELAMHRQRGLNVLCLLAAAFWLTACSGPKAPEDIRLQADIVAAADINPDITGDASPVAVVIYQLKSADVFMNGDFGTVFDPSGAGLGDSMLGREQVMLQPGETRSVEAEFAPDTAYIGVVAAFRQIDAANWRAIAALPEKSLSDKVKFFKEDRLQIGITADSVSVSIGSE